VAERSVDNRLTQVRFLTGLPTCNIRPIHASRRAKSATGGQNMQILSKPERLAAATIHRDGSGALNLTGDGAAF
jgi:hypothetical protein